MLIEPGIHVSSSGHEYHCFHVAVRSLIAWHFIADSLEVLLFLPIKLIVRITTQDDQMNSFFLISMQDVHSFFLYSILHPTLTTETSRVVSQQLI